MKSFGLSRYALCSCVAVAMLAGCGGSQPPIGAPGAPGAVAQSPAIATRADGAASYAHTTALLYVANWSPSTVQVYDAKVNNPSPIATITNGVDSPTDACIDAAGTLYIVNEPVTGYGSISEYAPGSAKPFAIITNGIDSPAACAIDAEGNLWETNFGAGNVTEYLKGTEKPHEIITKGLVTPNGIAIDHAGNLYVADGPSRYTPNNVQVYSAGSKSPIRTITDGVTSPVGITVDESATLYITNIRENNVEEYRAGRSRPYQTITASMNGPAGVTVSRKGRLYVCNYDNATVVEFAPSSITPSSKKITKELYTPQGSAYYPPLMP